MRSIQWCALALAAAGAVRGYVDTSPFGLFSTSEILNSARTLSSAEAITSEISSTLSLCPSDHYIIVSQAGVGASDYTSRKGTGFWSKLSSKDANRVRSTVAVPEVFGKIDISQWEQTLQERCGADVLHIDASTGSIPSYQSMPKVVIVSFGAPSKNNRARELSENDEFFASLMRPLLSSNYTVLYTTSPAVTTEEFPTEYNMDIDVQEPIHMGLKRELGSDLQRRATNQTIIDGPLFEKYQFFTPGIFMGFLVGFILLMILYVGISALASLQVTYAAFDKDQGALAKTKAQ